MTHDAFLPLEAGQGQEWPLATSITWVGNPRSALLLREDLLEISYIKRMFDLSCFPLVVGLPTTST